MGRRGWVPLEKMSWAGGRKQREEGAEGDTSQGAASALPGETHPTKDKQLITAPSSCISNGFSALSP